MTSLNYSLQRHVVLNMHRAQYQMPLTQSSKSLLCSGTVRSQREERFKQFHAIFLQFEFQKDFVKTCGTQVMSFFFYNTYILLDRKILPINNPAYGKVKSRSDISV